MLESFNIFCMKNTSALFDCSMAYFGDKLAVKINSQTLHFASR